MTWNHKFWRVDKLQQSVEGHYFIHIDADTEGANYLPKDPKFRLKIDLRIFIRVLDHWKILNNLNCILS